MSRRDKTADWKSERAASHRRIAGVRDIAARLCATAESWVGRPYRANPLSGGPAEPERLVCDLSGFDCVTFVESALAVARSVSGAGFLAELRRLRYRGGRVDWRARLHYFSDWMKCNHRRGAIRIRTRGPGARMVQARLSAIPELLPRTARFFVVPKRSLRRALPRFEDGSVVAFGSTRAGLDFFHVGLVFFRRGRPMLFHASKSRGRVLAEPLERFLAKNRTRGLAFATPLAPEARR